MKQSLLNQLHGSVWTPLKKWVNKRILGKDDNDDPFNHPLIIL